MSVCPTSVCVRSARLDAAKTAVLYSRRQGRDGSPSAAGRHRLPSAQQIGPETDGCVRTPSPPTVKHRARATRAPQLPSLR